MHVYCTQGRYIHVLLLSMQGAKEKVVCDELSFVDAILTEDLAKRRRPRESSSTSMMATYLLSQSSSHAC